MHERHGPAGHRHRRGPGAETPLAGFTAPYALALLARRGEMHGYALRDDLEGSGLLPYVDFGNLYRTLRRMEEAGLVASRWELEQAGPGRRLYTVTPAGSEFLGRTAAGLRAVRAGLDVFFALQAPAGQDAGGSDQK